MRAKQRYQWKQLSLGTCYYPEQWDRDLWRADLQRMLDVGICTIRIGESAWERLEPEEGVFSFAFLDEFMEVISETEMKVIFTVSTVAPPAWLKGEDLNALDARAFCDRMVERIAARYGGHPSIIGWQIGDKTAVRTPGDPQLKTESIRWISDERDQFRRMQRDILRKYIKSGDFIAVDGMDGEIDQHRRGDECLDVYTWDSYPNAAYAFGTDPLIPGAMNDRRWSDHLSKARAICPHFGIMEQQAGAGDRKGAVPAPAPKPGQMMLWTMQSIAHGADYVSFSRWRTCTEGGDIHRQGILDCDNRDNRRLGELKKIRDRVEAMRELAGADYQAAFGVVRDCDNIRDAQLDRWHGEIASRSEQEIFRTAQLTHTPMDYLYLLEETEVGELLRYPVLFYPHPLIMTEKRAALLSEYVKKGGCLIIGARAGLKDEAGKCVMTPVPGLLRELTGTEVLEGTFVGPGDEPVYLYSDTEIPWTGIYNEVLSVTSEDTRVLENYMGSSCYYDGAPAMTERIFGEGRVIHYGGTFTKAVTENLLAYTGVRRPYGDLIRLTGECELCVRKKKGVVWLFVLNYSGKEQICLLKRSGVDVDTGKAAGREIHLAAYETKVFRLFSRRDN